MTHRIQRTDDLDLNSAFIKELRMNIDHYLMCGHKLSESTIILAMDRMERMRQQFLTLYKGDATFRDGFRKLVYNTLQESE